jgi:outer membrane receptor protein involved in Fe transport
MNRTSRVNAFGAKLASLMGSASVLTIAQTLSAEAQQVAPGQMGAPAQVAQAQVAAEEIPENVLITGSLIRGAAAVGVPVVNLNPRDFNVSGALTTTDLFRTVPSAIVQAGPVATANAGNLEKAVRVQVRGLDTGTAQRELLMVDGMRVPPMTNQVAVLDASIIPALALDRIDVLVDGASATYGSDAITGVINIVLKRNFDGAVTQVRYTAGTGGKNRYQASQMWGRTWDGGDIVLTYEWHDESPMPGNFASQFTVDFSPWGLDDRRPIGSSLPGTISTGQPVQPASLGLFSGTSAAFGTNCSNCYAIPHGTGASFNPGGGGVGPTAAYSASTLNWASFNTAANAGTNGARNVFNPYTIGWYDSAEQTNRSVITLDQRLTKDISFYGEGYYSNRRSQFISPPNSDPTAENVLSVAVPSFNPYYPTGGAPTNLRVSYTTALERPGLVSAWQVDTRYQMGLNIALPANWEGKVYYARTTTQSQNTTTGDMNKNAISAALGWTIPVTPAAGTTPAIASWTKPSNVPYLNLFCDPYAFQCNSDTTLNYASSYRLQTTKFAVDEKGVNFDGPLFDVPAGTVKAAVGGTYTSFHFLQTFQTNQVTPTLLSTPVNDPREQQLWAVFTQVNVPVLGENFSLPGVRKFDLEGSWRHDQYSDFGGTSNAKAAFNWLVSQDFGLTIRGAWGQSFRAPDYAETSPTAGFRMQGFQMPQVFTNTATVSIVCDPGGHPAPGSAAEKLFNAGYGCNSGPSGVSLGGGSFAAVQSGLRDFVNTNQRQLEPETAVNYSIGVEFAPQNFLRGLDVQATWYQLKINKYLDTNFQLNNTVFNEGGRSNQILIPTDFGCPAATNLIPSNCPAFQNMVVTMLTSPRSQVSASAQPLTNWVFDLATMNRGWEKLNGIDFVASYDADLGDFGAINTGITGTYYLQRLLALDPTSEPVDAFHATYTPIGGVAQQGVETTPRLVYRGRLGWSNGPFSATAFVNYRSHWFHNNGGPFAVNNQCQVTGTSIGGGSFPCAITGYTNIVPSFYWFDVSLGYDTGDAPANDYLRNIQVQFIVQNIFNRHPAFSFRTGLRTSAWDIGPMGNGDVSGAGRQISLILTKTW